MKNVIFVMKDQSLVVDFFNLDETTHGQIYDRGSNIAGMDFILEQRARLGRRQSFRGLVHRRDRDSRIRIASPLPPGEIHYRERPKGKKNNRIASDEPDKTREAAGFFENAFGNIDVDGQAAAHGEWIDGLKRAICAFDLRGGVATRRSVNPGERLGAKRASGRFRKCHECRRVVDRYRPVISGDIPIKLIVVFKETHSVADDVSDLDRALRVDSPGNVNLQVAKAVGGGRVVLEFAAAAVGHARNIEKKRVVGPRVAQDIQWE